MWGSTPHIATKLVGLFAMLKRQSRNDSPHGYKS